MKIWERIDRVAEMLADLNQGSWAWAFWNQVHADLYRKAVRSGQ